MWHEVVTDKDQNWRPTKVDEQFCNLNEFLSRLSVSDFLIFFFQVLGVVFETIFNAAHNLKADGW